MSEYQNDYLEVIADEAVRNLVDYDDESEEDKEQNYQNPTNSRVEEMKNKPIILEDIRVDQFHMPVSSLDCMRLFELQEALVRRTEAATDKIATALESVTQVMSGAKAMLHKVGEISQANLEAERIKLRCLEIRKSMNSRVDESKVPSETARIKLQRQDDNHETVTKGEENNLEKQGFLDRSMEVIKKTIESEICNTKINIKREYKLSQKSDFELWMDYLRSELQSNDLLDVVDPNIQAPHISEAMALRRKGLVRDIIINHLDENYHKRILGEKDPKEILKRLRGYKKGETNVTHTSVRARLYQIKMRRDEKVMEFCERFDSIVREYEASEDAVPLTQQEKRSSFYQAVSCVVPELRNADLIRRQTTMKEMNLEEIKSFITQLEAEKQSELKEAPRAQRVSGYSSTRPEDRCHRCNDEGHWAKDCSLQSTGKWFCYHCKNIRTHKGVDCPLAKSSNRGEFKEKGNSINARFKGKSEMDQKSYPKINRGRVNKRTFRGRSGAKWVSARGQLPKAARGKPKQSVSDKSAH